MRSIDGAWRLGVALCLVLVAGAEAAAVGRSCVRQTCRPQTKRCTGAFRDRERDAIAACAERTASTSSKTCRRAAKQAARAGVRSCRASMRQCIACCDGGGTACAVGVCGNGLVEAREACDGTASGPCPAACRADCTCEPVVPQPVCGNGVVESGEACDGASDGACPGRCLPDCTCGPPCGNGVVDGDEACDGASDAACPGRCRADCTCAPPPEPVCGNGIVESGEECEPTVDDGSCAVGCTVDCRCAACGNGVVDAPFESCEPTDDAACPGLCSATSCECVSATTDTCEAPREIATFPYTDVQSTLAATTVPADPPFACGFEGAPVPHGGTVWYAFTPPGTGRVSVDTAASTFDTVLGVWSGTCDAPIQAACNDDGATTLEAAVDLPVAGGTRYLIAAAPYVSAVGGDLHLAVAFRPCGDGVVDAGEECEPVVPASCATGACSQQCECLDLAADECAGAPPAAALPVHARVAAFQSTGAADDPVLNCAPQSAQPPSTWFRFVAPVDGTVAISTVGSDYDTVLGVLTGDCGALAVVACDDDLPGGGYQSLVDQPVVAGTTYTVLVTPYLDVAPDRLELSIAYETP